jgi:hypothetical protein
MSATVQKEIAKRAQRGKDRVKQYDYSFQTLADPSSKVR